MAMRACLAGLQVLSPFSKEGRMEVLAFDDAAWARVAKAHLPQRTPADCRMYYSHTYLSFAAREVRRAGGRAGRPAGPLLRIRQRGGGEAALFYLPSQGCRSCCLLWGWSLLAKRCRLGTRIWRCVARGLCAGRDGPRVERG